MTTTYAGVLRHTQPQDKLNAKRLIHGICSIFRLLLYQINTKFVLTFSRRVHFLFSIHQHLNNAPQKKNQNKCEETWRHRDATTATLQQPRFIVFRKHFCGNSADFVRARGIFGWRRWRCSKDYRQQVLNSLRDSHSRQEAHWKTKQNLSEKALQIHQLRTSLQY